MWSDLVKKYRVLTVDMLGFGFSDKPYRHDYRILEQAISTTNCCGGAASRTITFSLTTMVYRSARNS
jgi:hypothetical protein